MGRLTLGATLIALLLAAPSAQAYKLGGDKWPRTITYHSSAPEWKSAIADAVHAWNTSGASIRFKATSRRRAALKIIHEGPIRGVAGRATLGRISPRSVFRTGFIREPTTKQFMRIELKGHPIPCGTRMRAPGMGRYRVRCYRGPHVWLQTVRRKALDDPETRQAMRMTAAHELGHVLGLKHVSQSRCALMAPAHPNQSCGQPPEAWNLRCRLLERDDVAGAVKRYGGTPKPLGEEFCEGYAPPIAPTGVTAAHDAAAGTVVAAWTNTPFPRREGAAVALERDACPADPTFAAQVARADERAVFYPREPGRYCAAVWARDAFGRYSAPVVAWVDVP